MNEADLATTMDKGKLIIKALQIIEKLAKNNIADTDIEIEGYDKNNIDELKTLIIEARDIMERRLYIDL